MAEQKTAIQHVVPKFYLRRFVAPDGQLEVYSKQWKKRLGRKNPSGIGYDLYFYGQKTGVEDDLSQEVETILHEFEDFVSDRYDGLCERILGCSQLTEEDHYTVALHACILWLRGFGMRKEVADLTSGLMTEVMRSWAEHPNVVENVKTAVREMEGRELSDQDAERAAEFLQRGEYRINTDNVTHLNMLSEYQLFTNLFMAKKLRIHIASGARRFITSDVPVLELLPKYSGPHSFYGYSFRERLHVLPLTSRIMVEFHDPDKLHGKPVIRRRVDDDKVAAANARQLTGAMVWCAGLDPGDFYTRVQVPGVFLPVAPHVGVFDEPFLSMHVG